LATVTVEIARFQTQYKVSDITEDVRNKFAAAIAYLIDINVSYVVLRFSERRRTLIQGAKVAVFVHNFRGSIAGLQSRLTLDRMNSQMAAWGLKPVDNVLGIPFLYTLSTKKSFLRVGKASSQDIACCTFLISFDRTLHIAHILISIVVIV
jgi:hypothetical protein